MTTNILIESAVTRLSEQFPRVPVRVIEETVALCQTHLSEMPAGALPELVERLAYTRLSETVRSEN